MCHKSKPFASLGAARERRREEVCKSGSLGGRQIENESLGGRQGGKVGEEKVWKRGRIEIVEVWKDGEIRKREAPNPRDHLGEDGRCLPALLVIFSYFTDFAINIVCHPNSLHIFSKYAASTP